MEWLLFEREKDKEREVGGDGGKEGKGEGGKGGKGGRGTFCNPDPELGNLLPKINYYTFLLIPPLHERF
jgi:hypothetical protein